MLFVAAEDGRCGGHAFIWWCRLASSACGGVQDATVAMAASIREAADSLMRAAASGERPRHTTHVLTRNVSEEAGACESKLPHEEMEGRWARSAGIKAG